MTTHGPLKRTALLAAALAAAAAGASIWMTWQIGVGLAAGLVLGALNPVVAQRRCWDWR